MREKQGLLTRALELNDQALKLANEHDFKSTKASILNNRGLLYKRWGKLMKSEACHQEALAIHREIGDKAGEATALNNISGVWQDLGDHAKAMECLKKAVELQKRIGGELKLAIGYSNMAWSRLSQGRLDQAMNYLQKSLKIEKKIGVKTSGSQDGIAQVYIAMGKLDQAKRFMTKLATFGRYDLLKGRYQAAIQNFEKELAQVAESHRVNQIFTSRQGLGLAYEGLKDYSKAVYNYKEAILVLEEIRESLPPTQRASFFSLAPMGFPRIGPYEGLCRALLKMGQPEEAYKAAESTRARVFAEALSRSTQSGSYDVPKSVLEADMTLNTGLATVSEGLQAAYEKGSKDAIESFTKHVRTAREKLTKHISMLRRKHPLFAATKYPQPMSLDQTALTGDQWALEYEVTDSGVCAFLIKGKKIVKSLFRRIDRKDLDHMVRLFRASVELQPGDTIADTLTKFDLDAGRKLTDILLNDMLSDIPAGTRLILIPDDSLGVLPFEMLVLNNEGKIDSDGRIPTVKGVEFFGDRNPISYYQSMTALTLARTLGKKKQSGAKTFVMDDPVFDPSDDRLQKLAKAEQDKLLKALPEKLMSIKTEIGLTFPRLPLTAELGEFIQNLEKGEADRFTGMKAEKEVLFKRPLDRYGSMVFATHGYFGKDLPGVMEPVLVLTLLDQPKGKDGFLRMNEVMSLKLNAGVVALTACQSGLGRRISGEGTMGMGRAFQYAGARSVLMSLWSVAESSSVKLVESFFRNLKEGKSKLDALQSARQEIRDQGYDHPFFWAPFILVGEVN